MRPRDPFSGTIYAAMGASVDITRAVTDAVSKPAKSHQRQIKSQNHDALDSQSDINAEVTNLGSPLPKQDKRGCLDVTSTMASASASGLGNFVTRVVGGAAVIPYAFTEGFRNLPLLYGEQVPNHGEIRDWKSGATVGAKVVIYDVADGISGLVSLPVKGAKEEGAVGAAKGVAKALAGLSSKVFAGTFSPRSDLDLDRDADSTTLE